MENKPEFYLENGNLVCRMIVGLDEEHRALHNEYLESIDNMNKLKQKLENHLRKANYACLPATKTMISCKLDQHNIEATYQFNGNYYVKKEQVDVPVIPLTPPNPNQIYIDLAQRYDFKQILGSGVLTKNEKRKCLGLPEMEYLGDS